MNDKSEKLLIKRLDDRMRKLSRNPKIEKSISKLK